MNKIFIKVIATILFILTFSLAVDQTVVARRGCCSHHGGVCGCQCCDGKDLSDKCAPYYPECNGSSESYISSNDNSSRSGFRRTSYTTPKVKQKVKKMDYSCLTLIITSPKANLRQSFSLSSPALSSLKYKTKLIKTDNYKNNFFEVKVADTNLRGWINKSVCGCP